MRPHDDVPVYLCREVVDMRKSINGLSILVEEGLELGKRQLNPVFPIAGLGAIFPVEEGCAGWEGSAGSA